MAERNYWLDLFSNATWKEWLDAGGTVSGFRESRWKTVQKIKPGDYLLCYLTGISRFIGVLEVVSPAFRDTARIWSNEDFPCRLRVKPIVALTPETAVPIVELGSRLTIFQNLKSPFAWTGHVRGSPAKWDPQDGEVVVEALREAAANPVARAVDERKLAWRPKGVPAKDGAVTVPEPEEKHEDETTPAEEPRRHAEIQWLLLKLGSDMGLDVWVARNDRKSEYQGRKFADIPRMKSEIPLQFDEATNRTIELIDVLWLKGNAIVAAFEVESTSSIYSGLLRMSDLIAMQPNLNIPLYLVAPDDRREKVISEVNRPTFSRRSPPMWEICRYISFAALRERMKQVSPYVRHLKPQFLEDLSESCEIEEA